MMNANAGSSEMNFIHHALQHKVQSEGSKYVSSKDQERFLCQLCKDSWNRIQ